MENGQELSEKVPSKMAKVDQIRLSFLYTPDIGTSCSSKFPVIFPNTENKIQKGSAYSDLGWSSLLQVKSFIHTRCVKER